MVYPSLSNQKVFYRLVALPLVHAQLKISARIHGLLLINLLVGIAQACLNRPIHTSHHNHQ